MLKFHVIGSSSEPYRITAEGEGKHLRMFCTCPAGKKGAPFCKHRQALLLGDVTRLIEPYDAVEALASRAVGSPLLQVAIDHKPIADRKPMVESVDTIQDLYACFGSLLEQAGFQVALVETLEPWPATRLNCHGRGKSGKFLKKPVVSIEWEAMMAIYEWDENLQPVLVGSKPRIKPFLVRGKNSISWTSLGRAAFSFLTEAGLEPELIFRTARSWSKPCVSS
ncbi:hypothetical protein [Rhizobium rhizoryzae]|uniref:SWIM-type domain-containing protein n=1 Tax=Rhizobium rhizoryzae TaxID=451876 RepID=A0A7W6PS25_9HYPH|nr:hypothetical protein [Rhizobium rhizoryzae]MBB4145855.1 hypothetical protein [Rhizobium rhizoryzae]